MNWPMVVRLRRSVLPKAATATARSSLKVRLVRLRYSGSRHCRREGAGRVSDRGDSLLVAITIAKLSFALR